MRIRLAICCIALCLGFGEQDAFAHGGVVLEEDLCVINIGYLRAHFRVYVPQERERREFCEDIPLTGESVFVMEYLHAGLSEAVIDFRVIRNVTGLGKFAVWDDVARIDDLDEATVFYHPPAVVPGVYSVVHRFDEPGDFIGIVTAMPLDAGEPYTAVFPFQVGFTGFGIWPVILIAIVLLQLHRWHGSGGLQRWLDRLNGRHVGTVAILFGALLLSSHSQGIQAQTVLGADAWFSSRAERFRVRVEPDLQPLAINSIHRWIVQVETLDGTPVTSAAIDIRGGMPTHDHGLPTLPEATEHLGEGRYLIEGMRFHMSGYWEVILAIDTGAIRDEVVIPVELQ